MAIPLVIKAYFGSIRGSIVLSLSHMILYACSFGRFPSLLMRLEEQVME